MPDTTGTVSVAIISPHQPTDGDFMSLMGHYCDIQKMARVAATSSSYGHATRSRRTVEATYEQIQCRFRHLDSDEKETTGRAGQIVDDYMLYVAFNDLPAELHDPSKATEFQVVNIRDLNGTPEDGGPFNIGGVQRVAGEDHHFRLDLRRVR